jgi:hypothetical protein
MAVVGLINVYTVALEREDCKAIQIKKTPTKEKT